MRISDQDLERLVHGNEPESQELARLAEALQNWQADFTRTPSEEQIATFASQAAEIALKAKPEVDPQTSKATPKSRFRALKYKLATGMAAVLMVSGMSGVAVASDGAAPGDALYGLDRALESIGINDGGPSERITEAQSLFAAGLTAEAVEHAAEAFEDDETAGEAVTALFDAAERVRTNAGNENASDTLTSVADMLQAMAEEPDRGPAFGEMVSNMAKNINGTKSENAGPPSELPDQSNGDPQGNSSENSGEPGRGSQGNQGSQGNGGPQGPPDDAPGRSDDAKGGRP